MADVADEKQPSMPMRLALDVVEALETANLLVIPREPTVEMLDAGAAAGRLDRDTARRIYMAMLLAAD